MEPAGLSIHAPARGATDVRLLRRIAAHFQSTRPRGARPIADPLWVTEQDFQSTRPRGARPLRCWCARLRGAFNPRAREGRDERFADFSHFGDLSIHAPARGATSLIAEFIGKILLSIHAPARGATGQENGLRAGERAFNPRAREGRDIGKRLLLSKWSTFNPRAREGRDLFLNTTWIFNILSIHAPARGAT